MSKQPARQQPQDNGHRVGLPIGSLTFEGSGEISVTLRSSRRIAVDLRSAIEGLTRLPRKYLAPADVREVEHGIELSYAAPPGAMQPLTAMVPTWRARSQVYLPLALGLAQEIVEAATELRHFEAGVLRFTPAQVFCLADVEDAARWALLPLPFDGVSLADWAHADAVAREWISADEVLGVVKTDRTYLAGAVLHHAIAGDLFRRSLESPLALRRLISYTGGQFVALRRALATAVPEALRQESRELERLVHEALAPRLGRPVTPAKALKTLERLGRQLGAVSLAVRWEAAGRSDVALSLLEEWTRFAPTEVPWDTVARLRGSQGDSKGAEEAQARHDAASPVGGWGRIARIRSILASEGPDSTTLDEVLAAAEAEGEALPEEAALYLAYVRGRYRGTAAEALETLQRDFTVTWHRSLSPLIAARLHGERKSWGEMSAAAKRARRQIPKLPDSGGPPGRYALAYATLLDGIAHTCAATLLRGLADYLEDAYELLTEGSELASGSNAGDVLKSCVTWLVWWAAVAGRYPRFEVMAAGAEAFAQSQGVRSEQVPPRVHPPIPWFDELRLFPGSRRDLPQ